MRCLVITSLNPAFDDYSYYQDWLDGFLNHPGVQVDVFDLHTSASFARSLPPRPRYDLIAFMHATYQTLVNNPRLGLLRGVLRWVRGERVFFLNNEFRDLGDKCNLAAVLGAKTLVSQLCQDDATLLYQNLWAGRVLSLPYGFTPQAFKPEKTAAQRSIDIGFRGDYYPPYVGHDDRDLLLDSLNTQLQNRAGVRVDIQVGQRLDRTGWAAFLNDCRALVGHEAGSTRLDSDENIRRFLNAQQKSLPPENFRKLVLALRTHGVFDPPPSGRIAAPRNFEAMGTKTLQILLPGRYNDLLQPNVHYLELQRDFSNLEKVLEALADEATYTRLIERAYADALALHTYEKRINTLLSAV